MAMHCCQSYPSNCLSAGRQTSRPGIPTKKRKRRYLRVQMLQRRGRKQAGRPKNCVVGKRKWVSEGNTR